jgi:hypothetical protein
MFGFESGTEEKRKRGTLHASTHLAVFSVCTDLPWYRTVPITV